MFVSNKKRSAQTSHYDRQLCLFFRRKAPPAGEPPPCELVHAHCSPTESLCQVCQAPRAQTRSPQSRWRLALRRETTAKRGQYTTARQTALGPDAASSSREICRRRTHRFSTLKRDIARRAPSGDGASLFPQWEKDLFSPPYAHSRGTQIDWLLSTTASHQQIR